MTSRIALQPSRPARVGAAGLAVLAAFWLVAAVALPGAATFGLAAFTALAAVVLWQRSRCWVDVAPDRLTIHHMSLSRPAHVPAAAIGSVLTGDALDVAWSSTLPRSKVHNDATLVLMLDEPVKLRLGLGGSFTARKSLALVASDPAAAEDALRGLGAPVETVRAAAPAVHERRRRKRRLALVAVIGWPLLFAALKLGGFAIKDHRAQAHWKATHDADGRWLLPAWPGGSPAFAATAADGSELRAWRVSDTTLRVRIDVAAAPCSGAAWRDSWHATDFRTLRLSAGGAYSGRLRSVKKLDGGVDVITATVRGRVRDGRLSAALTRTDDYRGWPDSGVCRHTLEVVAPRASTPPD